MSTETTLDFNANPLPNHLLSQIESDVLADLEEFSTIRRQIHSQPELGFEENKTSQLVAEQLKRFGFEVHTGIGKTGVVGQIRCGTSQKSMGIRADMDALPIKENTNLPWASKVFGKMHACGHDGHTAILLTAAKHIARMAKANRFNGIVNLIFQPAEEGLGGAKLMIEDGLFTRFPCDEIYGLHNGAGVPVGKIIIQEGPFMASADSVVIDLHGKGGHAAMPQLAADVTVAAASIVMALQTVISRNIAAQDQAVITVGSIQAGQANNVIPAHARLLLTVRAFDINTQKLIEQRIRTLVHAQAESFGVRAEIDYQSVMRVLINNPETTATIRDVATKLVGEENIVAMPRGRMGSEDFSWMLEKVKGTYVFMGNGTLSVNGCSTHNPGYDFNDQLLPLGASLWTRLIEHVLR